MKIGEEFGETVEAWIGLYGENPRKGIWKKQEDVIQELADVAITALVAIQSQGYHASNVLMARMVEVYERTFNGK